MARNKITLNIEPKPKKKPRGKPFAKGNEFAFPKGQSGNPGGRPKGSGSKKISEAYTAILEQKIPEDVAEKLGLEGDVTWADAIAIQTAKNSVGLTAVINHTSVTELREVTEGKLPEKTEMSGAGGTPLTAPTFAVNFVKAKDGKPAPKEEQDAKNS